MFGKNVIVGQKEFAGKDKLQVVSRFMTLQGEGPYSGLPAFFVRLARCNLACSWCDAYFDDGDWFSVDDLLAEAVAEIKAYYGDKGTSARTLDGGFSDIGLVVTGGEPTLQPKLFELLYKASDIFAWTQIESNGILEPIVPKETTVVISPKCMEKKGVATKYLTPNHKTLDRADVLKFIINDDPESPYSTIPDWAFNWRNASWGREIFVSPMNFYKKMPKKFETAYGDTTIEGRSNVDEVVSFWEPDLLDMEKNQRTHEYTAKYAIANGLRFNLQAHLYAGLA